MAAIAERIGGALLAAADAGVVHGRVDPAAVLFDNAGAPYLTDFRLGTGPAACAAHADGCDCDAAGFAALLRACRPGGGGVALDALLADPPPIAELVPAVVRALSPDEPVEVARPNPYKGLQAFGEADAAVFFGRAALLDELTERLASDGTRARLVLVVGGSGTGKSSAVRAGLLPRIRAGAVPGSSGWLTTTMVPGADPWHSLALALRPVAVTDEPDLAATLAGSEEALDAVLRALLPDDGQLVLVVDQFEELFTLADERVQRQFAAALVHAITAPDSRLRVVATMRADLYDRPLAIQGLGPLVAPATVAIAAMTPSELEAAIVEPIQLVGGRVEGALLVELVDAVVREPAALPSLQFALYQLAEQAPDKVLTLADHQRLGGVSGAIASRAEAVFTALDGGSQAVVRRLFARLVVLDEVGEPARRRVSRGELASVLGPGADAVVDRLADARLLTVDRDPQTRLPTVEVAHEALLREWPRLRGWIDEDRDAIAVLDGLRDAATTWDGLGRDPGALLRGARLEVALDLVDARGEPLPPLERELLDASRAARDAEAREAAERLERQARANRRLRLQLAAIAVALVVALVGGLAALDQRRDAERERRVATARELAAAAIATLGTDPELSTLLALEAIAESRRAGGDVLREAEEALHRAVTTSRVLLRVAGTGGDVDWPDDTSTFVAEGPEESGLVEVYDATTGEVLASWTGHDVDVNEVAMSPDGALVATTGDDGALRVWDAATGELVLDVARPEWGGTTWSPVFTPDSRLVAASWLDTDWTAIFDVRTGEEVSRVDGIAGMSTSFSPDGDRLAIGLLWGPPAVVDVATGLPLLDLDVGELGVNDVAWSPDGRWIAGSDSEGMVRLFDAATGQVAFVASGHQGEVEAIDWSADASRLASVSGDGTVRIWDVGEHGAVLAHVLTTNDNRGGLMGVALSPDGDRVLTGDAAITNVTVWDVSPTGGAEWANVEVGWSWDAASFTPDGASARVRTGDGIALVDAATGEPAGLIPLVAEAAALRVRPSPDGDLLAVSGEGGPGPVRDARTGEVRWEFGDPFGFVLGMAWSGDGRYLAASLDSPGGLSIAVFDRSGEELFVRPEQEGEFTRWISMNGDGSLIATTVGGTTRNDPDEMVIRLWDWAADEVVRTIATDVPYDSATFAPSGDHLVATGWLVGIVEIWDAGTGERVATLAAPPITSSIAYSPDGTRVVTGHRDGTVRVWDAATGRQLLTLAGHQRLVTAVAVSADGSRLLSVADDGLARVWALDLDDLIELARGRSTRGFTDDECRQHLHLDRCPAA